MFSRPSPPGVRRPAPMISPAERGVVYICWGDRIRAELDRSRASLARWHPELPVEVVWLAPTATLLDKAAMFDRSPFASTLFLDTDTVVLDRLDFGFEQAEKHGLACSICECPYARRFGDLHGDLVEYNTGVLFFTRAAEPVFRKWDELNRRIDSSVPFHAANREIRVMVRNDQAGFALAMAETGFNPFVLPLNWNLRPDWQHSWFGPVKVWHDRTDVPPVVRMHNETQRADDAIVDFFMLKRG